MANTMLIGYARVSSLSQSNDIQREALRKAGCKKVYEEKVSGKSRDGRTQLATILDHIRDGDTLVVTKLDRLGRDTRDVLNIVHEITDRGAHLRVLEPAINTRETTGKVLLQVFGMVAEMGENVSPREATCGHREGQGGRCLQGKACEARSRQDGTDEKGWSRRHRDRPSIGMQPGHGLQGS